MAFYTVQGRTNYYIDIGEGRPVLLLHGISNSGRVNRTGIAGGPNS